MINLMSRTWSTSCSGPERGDRGGAVPHGRRASRRPGRRFGGWHPEVPGEPPRAQPSRINPDNWRSPNG